jgi:hypothetical protein
MAKDRLAKQSYMNWDVSLETAKRNYGAKRPQDIATQAAVRYDAAAGEHVVPFLNQEYLVRYPSGDVYLQHGEDVQITNQILILHYLEHAEGVPLQHRWISFKEIPCGQIYINPFYNRAIRPLIELFGHDPQGLIAAGLSLGGRREGMGDASIVIPAFPLVPVAYVIWVGDDEFEASGNILFDKSAPHFLPLEDYAVIAGAAVFELRKQLDRPV